MFLIKIVFWMLAESPYFLPFLLTIFHYSIFHDLNQVLIFLSSSFGPGDVITTPLMLDDLAAINIAARHVTHFLGDYLLISGF